jgi:hypothetical protein
MALENNQIDNSNLDNDEISLKELILSMKKWGTFLKTKWKLILIAGILGGSIGIAIAFNDKPIYKAVLTFAMDDDKGTTGGSLGGALGIASSLGIDIGGGGGGAFSSNNLFNLMKSRLLVEKVLLNPVQVDGKIISIAEYYLQINSIRNGWKKNSDLQKIKFQPNESRLSYSLKQDSVLKEIYSNLTNPNVLMISQKDKKATITSVEFSNGNEKFSKLFCENLAKAISDYYIEIKSKKARINFEILKNQTDSVRALLNYNINGLANANDNVYNLNPAFNIKRTPALKKQIDLEASKLMLTQLVANLEMAKVNLRRETPLIQIIDRPILPLDKEQVSKRKSLIYGLIIGVISMIIFITLIDFYKKIVN